MTQVRTVVEELRCQMSDGRGTCGARLGETVLALKFVGVVRRWEDRQGALGVEFRHVARCPSCGWYNLYIVDVRAVAS